MTSRAWLATGLAAALGMSLSAGTERAEAAVPHVALCQDTRSQEPLPEGVARREGRVALQRGYQFRAEGPNRISVGRMVRSGARTNFVITGTFSCGCLAPTGTAPGACMVINTGTDLQCRTAGCTGACMMTSTGTIGARVRAPQR